MRIKECRVNDAFFRKNSPELSGCFWLLQALMGYRGSIGIIYHTRDYSQVENKEILHKS